VNSMPGRSAAGTWWPTAAASYAPTVRPAGDAQIGSLAFYGVGILTG
jgi:hypothetical protein